MQGKVSRDTTTREITIEVTSVPDLDVTQSWHSKPRVIRPDRVTIRIVKGETRLIAVRGWLVLKSGRTSTQISDKAEWRLNAFTGRDKVSSAPEWVQVLWREAPVGVTGWTMQTASA